MDQRQEGQRPKKRRRGRRISRAINTLSYIVMILGISLILSAFGILLANDMLALIKEDQAVRLVYDTEQTPAEMARLLTENEIIQYGWAFKLFAGLKNIEGFQAGSYEISSGMDYGQIIDTLTHKAVVLEEVSVTIPEGFSIRQIAQLMEKELVCSADNFIKTANTYKFSHTFLKTVPMVENRLEGYLFPDTYSFYKTDDLSDPKTDRSVSVINKMLNNFANKITPEMKHLMSNRGVTLDRVIIIASLIEREAKVAAERTTISGVIYNRLDSENYRRLEIDAAILYALPEHKGRLTSADKEIDSPYNTYKAEGLPPTAICNPGLSAILAAISPEQHAYYFYVVDDLEAGSHAFAKTYKQHQKNVEAYQKLLDQAAKNND